MDNLETFKYAVQGVVLVNIYVFYEMDIFNYFISDCPWLYWSVWQSDVFSCFLAEADLEVLPSSDALAGNV